jgi:SAM-dependent methyltransferase
VIAKFNDRSDSYARSAVVQRDLAVWLAEWLEPARSGDLLTALELGAGDGLFTRHLAQRYVRLAAVDLAPRMVDRGQRLLPHVQWRVANAWCLDCEPVDRLFSASLLQWCDDPVSVLRHWQTLVKRGGRMLHGFYVTPTLAEWQSLAEGLSPIEWRASSQWQSLFCESGWRVLRSERETRVQRFASAREMLCFFHRTGAVSPRRTPVGQMRRILANYDRRFLSTEGNSGITTTWTFFRIEAVSDK